MTVRPAAPRFPAFPLPVSNMTAIKGWGIAGDAITEEVLGADVTKGAYSRAPEESRARIIRHLGSLCPKAFGDDLARLIRQYAAPEYVSWRGGNIKC